MFGRDLNCNVLGGNSCFSISTRTTSWVCVYLCPHHTPNAPRLQIQRFNLKPSDPARSQAPVGHTLDLFSANEKRKLAFMLSSRIASRRVLGCVRRRTRLIGWWRRCVWIRNKTFSTPVGQHDILSCWPVNKRQALAVGSGYACSSTRSTALPVILRASMSLSASAARCMG